METCIASGNESKNVFVQFVISSRLHYIIEMELLKLNRKIHKIVGLCSLSDESGFHLRIGQLAIVFLEIAGFTVTFGTSLLYFWEHYPKDGFESCILSVAQMIAAAQVGISFISLVVQAEKVRDAYDQIQELFDQCE